MKKYKIIVILFLLFSLPLAQMQIKKLYSSPKDTTEEVDRYWWPKQPIPKGIISCQPGNSHGEKALSYSLAGMVAQAQKKALVDELIWFERDGEYKKWYTKVMLRLGAEDRGSYNVWELLEKYNKLGIIKGYIIYKEETERRWNPNMDFSYNIAVSYAGVKQAVVVEEKLESKMIELGFSKLLDARNISQETCFNELKDSLSNDIMVTMNPHYHNNTDLAIANNAIHTYGNNDLTDSMMSWMKPVSPVVGWNHGEELHFTSLPSKHGLFNTASDWCSNLITLSAGSEKANPEKIHSLDPKTIDFNEGEHFHSFIMSDGDNMQWTIGNFLESKNFWGSPLHGDFPIGFTSCPLNLSMMAPDVLDEMARTQPPHTTVIEYGGGYQYPGIFAREKGENQEEIQRAFAKKINLNMKRTGVNVFGFICIDVDSPEAIEAYKIYAEEIEDLVGMFVVQYAPYHGGKGETYWVKNRDGIEIPVVSAKFALWKGLKEEGGGDVLKVSKSINKLTSNTESSISWTSVHAWSKFENPSLSGDFSSGVKPISWCINQLNKDVNIVSPEELLWRLRWERDSIQTSLAINK